MVVHIKYVTVFLFKIDPASTTYILSVPYLWCIVTPRVALTANLCLRNFTNCKFSLAN